MRDTILRPKNQITLPTEIVAKAGFRVGDRLVFRCADEIVWIQRAQPRKTKAEVLAAIKATQLKVMPWAKLRDLTR